MVSINQVELLVIDCHDIITRESKQMMRTFIMETGESLTGPWQSIQKYRADIIGPEDPNEPGIAALS